MAEILQQGENYEDSNNGPENDLIPNKNNNNKIAIIAIVGVLVVVIIVLAVIFITRKSTDNEEQEVVSSDDTESDFWDDADDFIPEDDFFEDNSTVIQEPADSAERTELRKYGYSNDEIEYALSIGMTTDQLIEEATKLQEEKAAEFIKEAGKKGSKTYKKLLRDTWLDGDTLTVPSDMGDDIQYLEQITINCDYKKIEPHGKQLWLKCNCKEYGDVFLDIDCERWNQLDDKGNIVVCLSVEDYYGTKVVVDIVEIDAGDRPSSNGDETNGDDFWEDAD